MQLFQLHPDSPPFPSPMLPTGSNPEVSPDTVESSLVTVIPHEDFLNSAMDSLDDVPSLPIDPSEFSRPTPSSIDLPDPPSYLTYVRDHLLTYAHDAQQQGIIRVIYKYNTALA